MWKVTILTVFALSTSAQFNPERRPYEGENLKINGDEPRVNSEFREEGLRNNQRPVDRPENTGAGGFQNGNFAYTDGRLRTNLDSNQPEYSGQNLQQRLDSPYVVEEGAAFRRQDNRQFDVHGNAGRVNDDSYAASERGNFEGRKQTQGLEQIPTNVNDQSSFIERGQNSNERLNNDQNNQQRKSQGEGQIYSHQNEQHVNNDAQTNDRFNNHNTRQTTTLRNQPENDQNIGTNSFQNAKPVTNFATNSTSTRDRMTNEEREAMDKQINNQIAKMYFDASVQEVTTKRNTKHAEDPARNSMGKKDDRWIWNVTTTADPTVDDRAAFVGDQCPTNQVRFNNVCVDRD